MATKTKAIDLKELNKLADKIAGKLRVTSTNIDTAVKQAVYLIDQKAKEKIAKNTGRSGRIYTRGSVTHQASAAGEVPALDTGRLNSSIRPVFYSASSAEVGSLENIAVYGAMLEKGTKHMKKRPWLAPTLKENTDEITKIFADAIKRGGAAT